MKKAIKIILFAALIIGTLIMIYSIFEFIRDGLRFEAKYGIYATGISGSFAVRLMCLGLIFSVALDIVTYLYIREKYGNHIRYTYEEYKAKMDARSAEKEKAKIEKLKAEIEKQEKGE
jgi:uncharacterized membrane protein (DUF106 family)